MQILWILVWAVGCFTSPVLELFEVFLLERFRQQNPTMTGDARLGKGGKWPYAGIYASSLLKFAYGLSDFAV